MSPSKQSYVPPHRRNGRKVRGHSRTYTWKSTRTAWKSAGLCGLSAGAGLLVWGFELIPIILGILTLALVCLSVMLELKASAPKRRTKAKARKKRTTARR